MANSLREAVASGEYASASEVVRDALRAWTHKRRLETLELGELRQLIQEGADSGPGIDATRVFSRLESKYAAMRKQR
jgi:antitoxin ParD1/3/4